MNGQLVDFNEAREHFIKRKDAPILESRRGWELYKAVEDLLLAKLNCLVQAVLAIQTIILILLLVVSH